ncbi:MAG: PASTA domain-containing protein [Desulfobacterales bacterium]|nr:MAG: PASTA domain-containing protein [Desulfobacterales bacterium]
MVLRIVKISGLLFLFILVVGTSAYLTLSLLVKSEDTVVVPNLEGKNVVYVLELLTDLGLNTKVKGSEYSPDVPKNHVIFQEPEPGAEIKQGRDIRIILSRGTRSILIPNLKGLSVQQARIILEENSLCQGEISSTYSRNLKKDKVISQMPSQGTMTSRGECINLLLSLGMRPRAYKMPALKGLSIDEALLLIEGNHMALGEITSAFHEDKTLNTIIYHEPHHGYRVIEGTAVNLVINRAPGRSAQEYVQNIEGVELFRYRVKDGFLKKRIKVILNSYSFSNEMFNGLMKPNEEIWLIIPKNINATLFLYEEDELIEVKVYDAW